MPTPPLRPAAHSRFACGPSRALRPVFAALLALVAACFAPSQAHAGPITIDWVTVGDPGNVNNTNNGRSGGGVNYEYQIMKYEWTNSLYVEYLNAVDPNGTNPNSIYNTSMSTSPRGGVTNTGTSNGSRYVTKPNMGDKPVNYVSWYDAARVANWLHNGGQRYGSSDASATAPQNTGAYTLGTATSGPIVVRNEGAAYVIPSVPEFNKAAYYKGGSTDAGYWKFATASDTVPGAVTSGSSGIGSAGSFGNFVNYNNAADWNGQNGNVTRVGTNGGPSAYGTFDMNGNVGEWISPFYNVSTWWWYQAGGDFSGYADPNSDTFGTVFVEEPVLYETEYTGFRLASPIASVPEPGTWALAVAGLAGVAVTMRRQARRRRRSTS